jgi:hypothetical protein
MVTRDIAKRLKAEGRINGLMDYWINGLVDWWVAFGVEQL